MRSTIVVAAHNEGELLKRTLRSVVESARGLEYELLIADDHSTDGSVAAAEKEFPRAKVVRSARQGGASPCKAMGADAARGNVLIFLDGHTKPEPGSLEALVKTVEDLDGKDIVTPRVMALDTVNWTNKAHQTGHGYAINLDKLSCWWIPRPKMREVQKTGRMMYESPALIGCAMGIGRPLNERLWGCIIRRLGSVIVSARRSPTSGCRWSIWWPTRSGWRGKTTRTQCGGRG